MKDIMDFITNNQFLLSLLLVIGSYFLNKFINVMADREGDDIWDKIRPASNELYSIVHAGIEAYSKAKPMSSIAKNQTYLLEIQKFEEAWKSDKTKAVKELAAWYFSMKQKEDKAEISGEQLTADTVATE